MMQKLYCKCLIIYCRKDLHAGGWNVLECLEHLNLYGDFYLPEIRKRIVESSFPPGEYFKSGWLGDYFVKSMEPGKTMKKMKTFKDKDPIKQVLNRIVLTVLLNNKEKY
jgi:hypothetical protein